MFPHCEKILESKHKPDCGPVAGRLWVFVYVLLRVCAYVCTFPNKYKALAALHGIAGASETMVA